MTPRSLAPSEIPPGNPERIALLLREGRVELTAPDPKRVTALWGKALASARDAELPGLSADTAVDAAYKALLQGAMALLESEGLRAGGASGGHHHDTFYAAAGLGHDALRTLDVDSEPVRKLRARSVYEPESVTPADLARLIGVLARVLPAIRRAILARQPELETALAVPEVAPPDGAPPERTPPERST